MTSQLMSVYAQIHARLEAGDAPMVQAVTLEDGAHMVRWGVEGVMPLECTFANARSLAAVMDRDGYVPGLGDLLRAAADICESKSAVLQ